MNNNTKKRDNKGRFVKQSKSAEQIAKEYNDKKRREEKEKLEQLTQENPAEAIAEDAEPMHFETPVGSPTEEEEGTGLAIAVAIAAVIVCFAIAAYCIAMGMVAP